MLVVFTVGSDFRILSTIARLSGGTYEPILEKTKQWRKSQGLPIYGMRWFPLDRQEEAEFLKEYLTGFLLCGKPESISANRWLLKCLSNDQTAFTGFTSLVDVVEDNSFGYNKQIKVLPKASFVEKFVLDKLGEKDQQKLLALNEQLKTLDSTQVREISELLEEAEIIAPVKQGRTKGKAPIFFYGISDQPFLIPKTLYERMEAATKLACEGISEVANRFDGDLDKALFGNQNISSQRQFYTGSIDFMLVGNDIYIIDIGTPAVGYVADIIFASEALGREPDIGLDILARSAGKSNLV